MNERGIVERRQIYCGNSVSNSSKQYIILSRIKSSDFLK
jgi:hypothetical protein